jgi:hypothetical protein
MTPGDSKIKNNSSHFTFNGTFDNLTPSQAPMTQNDLKILEALRKNEEMHAMNIIKNFAKLLNSQGFLN